MRSITKPVLSADEVIRESTKNMRGNNAQKYLDAIPVIEEYSEIHDTKMEDGIGYQLSSHVEVTAEVDKDEMTKLYNQKVAKKGQPGRKFYNAIMLTAPRGMCPYCGAGCAATLDHYFPKVLYPKLAVTPQNLIPSCRDCNTEKLDFIFSRAEDMPIHPYYEEVQSFDWLVARIVSTAPVCLAYSVSETVYDPVLKSRLQTHMQIFKLNKIYAIKASEEICSVKNQLEHIFSAGGEIELNKYIREVYESCYANEKNSWKTALYKALEDTQLYVADTGLLL